MNTATDYADAHTLEAGTGLPEAEHALRRLRRVKWRMAENETVLTDAQEWLATENAPLLAEAARLEQWLTAWMAARLEADPAGPKNVRLPSGEISTQAGGLRVDIVDEAAFLTWASANLPNLLRLPDPAPPPTPEVDKNAVKAAVGEALMCPSDRTRPGTHHLVDPATGEAVPGIALIRDPRTTKVRTA